MRCHLKVSFDEIYYKWELRFCSCKLLVKNVLCVVLVDQTQNTEILFFGVIFAGQNLQNFQTPKRDHHIYMIIFINTNRLTTFSINPPTHSPRLTALSNHLVIPSVGWGLCQNELKSEIQTSLFYFIGFPIGIMKINFTDKRYVTGWSD